jgi:SapC
MTRHALLNNVEHRDLRIITRRGADVGDDIMSSLTFPAEFRNVQSHYPIVFAKWKEGNIVPLALFGFREKQNLFLQGTRWDALYMPMMVERVPFLIGSTPHGKVIHIDMDSPRISRSEGERVFLEHGGNTEYLEHVTRMMGTLDEGLEATSPFVDALLEHNLLESFVIDMEFRDGAQRRFAGFQTIQEERLAKLDAAALGKLHARGHLQAIYMVVASFSNFRSLIERAQNLNAEAR